MRVSGEVRRLLWILHLFHSTQPRLVEVHIIGFVWDRLALSLEVALPPSIPTSQASPHITFALAPSVKPVYSNALLAKSERAGVGVKGRERERERGEGRNWCVCSPMAQDEEFVCSMDLPMRIVGKVGTALF